MKNFPFHIAVWLLVAVTLLSCNQTKYVPADEYLLNRAKVEYSNKKDIPEDEVQSYLRQTPNNRVFGLWKMGLGIYNWSGLDTAKWLNEKLRKIGEEPVIYDDQLTSVSAQQLQLFFRNKGYFNAVVETKVKKAPNKKVDVRYVVKENKPYYLNNYSVNIRNRELSAIATDTARSVIRPHMLFDADVLNSERDRIAGKFRQSGYYNFNKELLSYTADSTMNNHQVNLSLGFRDFSRQSGDSSIRFFFKKYSIRNVIFYANSEANLASDLNSVQNLDTVSKNNYVLIGPKKKILKLDALIFNTYITPGTEYNDAMVQKTYSSLNTLPPVKYVNISFREVKDSLLDCYITIMPTKYMSLSTEVEATYTNGYWGMAGNVSYLHRNIFKGAESLSLSTRVAYELQDQVWAKEWGINAGLKVPRFIFPFLSYDYKKNIHASTTFLESFSYQSIPNEFETQNIGLGMKYTWIKQRYQHAFDLFDLNYVTFNISDNFKDEYLNTGIFNKYYYSDHFIMRMGYSGTYNGFNSSRPLRNYSTSRYSVEAAGNSLYLLNKLIGTIRESDGSYKLFNIRYSQYAKAEYNVTYNQIFDQSNRFVYHAGLGIGIPYGNADVIPYEKRFYSGGANSVRGWGESKLGPGVYKRTTGTARDYNQAGDIKLDLNMEYRTKMIWKLEGAFFVDAGNIWTIKKYDEQEGGQFQFGTFLNQIAIAYGAGLRFDFKFFILRFDMGVKLKDPTLARQEQWIVQPVWNDLAFHFAIGYPF